MKYDEEVWSRLKPRRRSASQSQQRPSDAAIRDARRRKTSPAIPERPTTRQDDVSSKNAATKQPAASSAQKKQKTVQEGVRSKLQKVADTVAPKKKLFVGGIAVFAALGIVTGATWLMSGDRDADNSRSLGVSSVEIEAGDDVKQVDELSFSPFYPEDYEERGIVFAQRQRGDNDYITYTDVLDGVPFTVTQQRVTDDFSGDNLLQLENLARSLPVPAENFFQVDDIPVFIGVGQGGQQSLTMLHEEVLIFVSAESEVNEITWVRYIQSLIQNS